MHLTTSLWKIKNKRIHDIQAKEKKKDVLHTFQLGLQQLVL
jgi:hypothetical protein